MNTSSLPNFVQFFLSFLSRLHPPFLPSFCWCPSFFILMVPSGPPPTHKRMSSNTCSPALSTTTQQLFKYHHHHSKPPNFFYSFLFLTGLSGLVKYSECSTYCTRKFHAFYGIIKWVFPYNLTFFSHTTFFINLRLFLKWLSLFDNTPILLHYTPSTYTLSMPIYTQSLQ